MDREVRETLFQRKYAEYIYRRELLDDEKTEMVSAFNYDGVYIGTPKVARFLTKKKGLTLLQKAAAEDNICSIGFQPSEQKWFGWSHRAIHGFGIGDTVDSSDHLCNQSGWTDEYLKEHPEADERLPVGFTAKTLDDAKKMAIVFASSVA